MGPQFAAEAPEGFPIAAVAAPHFSRAVAVMIAANGGTRTQTPGG